jgi:hypothetical protein
MCACLLCKHDTCMHATTCIHTHICYVGVHVYVCVSFIRCVFPTHFEEAFVFLGGPTNMRQARAVFEHAIRCLKDECLCFTYRA